MSVSDIDYTSTAAFPAFASKAALMQELSDFHNTMLTDPMGFLARVANTDTSGWSDPTAALGDITDIGKLL